MGKKREAREALERARAAAEAAQAEVEALRLEALREAEVEPVGDTMTKAERKAAKRAAKTAEAATAIIEQAERTHAGDFGAVVTSTPIPDVEQLAQQAAQPAELERLAQAMDPALVLDGDPGTEQPAPAPTPGTTPQPSDPGVVVGELAPLGAAPEVRSVEPVERDRWGRPVIVMPDGSKRGYRRVTTFIDVLEDKSNLADWGKRNVLEGALLDYRDTTSAVDRPSLINRVGKALDDRDLVRAEVASDATLTRIQTAEKAWKSAMKALVAEAEDKAGAHDKATKGTDLHGLTELVDQGLPLPDSITDADRRDLAAYAQAVKEAGIVFTERERFVVLDQLQVGGTLDRAGLFRFPGTARARRCVMDIKTGRVDYSPGKIAMQLAVYAHGLAYDRDTGTRTDLKLDKTKALLIHLPAGEGRCSIVEVDIAAAWSKAVRLASEVYAWRTEGKSVYDIGSPLVSIDLAASAA